MARPAEAPSIEVVWEAPPEKKPASKYWGAIKQVKENRGRWARVRGDISSGTAHSAASNVRKLVAGDPHWLVVTRPMEEGGNTFGLWMIYRTPDQLRADNGG